MTMINPYGIGAGRAISEQIEGAPDKDKKEVRRRLTAAQIAEQERLKARLQHRSTEYVEPNLLQQSPEPRPGALRTLRSPQTIKSQQSEALADEEMIAQSGQRPSELNTFKTRASVLESTSIETDERYTGVMPDAARGGRPVGSLLYDIGRSPAKLTRERALSNLNSLNDSLRSRRSADIYQEDNDSVLSYLEFLEGYFDSTAKGGGHSEKIATLMSEIRIQLSLAADPGRAGVSQHAAIANQARQPADPVPAIRAREHHKLSKRGRVGIDDDKGVDGDVEQQSAAIPPQPSATPAGGSPSQSSLGKDSNRKRDETIVSVTLRSV